MTSPELGTLHSTPGGFSGPRTTARGVDNTIKGGISMRTTGMGTPITQYCLALMAMLLLTIHLSVFYPHPGSWPGELVFFSYLALTVVSVVFIVQGRKRPYLLAGW